MQCTQMRLSNRWQPLAMNRLALAVLVLAVLRIACVMSSVQFPTPTADVTPTPPASPSATRPPAATVTATEATSVSEDVQTSVIMATVWVRAEADSDSERIGSLTTGEQVEKVAC